MKPIAIFYHTLTHLGDPPELLDSALNIISEQFGHLHSSGLVDAASKIVIGNNGNNDANAVINIFSPPKSEIVFHGLDSRAENLTIIEIEKFVKDHPDWYVLYFHCKGATHADGSDYASFAARWRRCMMKRCVIEWKRAVEFLDQGYDAAGCHWLTGMGHDKSQHYFAGNFWWATSNFLATVPSMYLRDRIKQSGIANVESRYESEVWIGNGPRPKIMDLETTHGFAACP